ncbi:MAG: AbrB/MazE/SpoVT family DNA-binding domain-containing protein [Acidobacteriaceae bacterium]|nr:AbrB/MazE/SpoVT family DNA-binding domain-containing protein [Acidobacteriaceae bacterium]
MKTTVKMWGNSASVRIPAGVMEECDLRIDQTVNVRAVRGRIVIEPLREVSYDLDQLLADMKPETFHEDVDFGPPVGKEVW